MTETTTTQPRMWRYSVNLCAILATGIWVSLWFIYNSEWFPLIGGALGLGSFLAWAAFVVNLLSDERKKQYQSIFDHYVLDGRATAWLLIAINIGVIVWLPGSHGGLEFVNTSEAQSLSLYIAPEGKETAGAPADEPIFIPPQGSHKDFLASGFFGEQAYLLEVGGAPAIAISGAAFTRHTWLLPDAAWRQPLVLVRPTEQTAEFFKSDHSTYAMTISRCSGSCGDEGPWTLLFDSRTTLSRYRGSAVLLGSANAATLPDIITRRWKAEGLPTDLAETWSHPIPAEAKLSAQEHLKVEVLNADDEPLCSIGFDSAEYLLEARIMDTCESNSSYVPLSYRF